MSDCEGCFSCDFDCCDCDDDAGCDDDSGCDLCCLCIDVGKFLDSTGKVAFFYVVCPIGRSCFYAYLGV